MLAKPDTCRGCPLFELGEGFMHVDGSGANGVLLVFEALGKDEAAVGLPIVGATGLKVEEVFQRGGFKRNDFKIANSIWCRPPGNKLVREPYYEGALKHCAPYLDAVITEMRPRCIVAAGAVALKRLLPDVHVGIDAARGYVHPYTHPDGWTTWVVPTPHPARILRGQSALTLVIVHDLSRALDIARDGFSYLPLDFLTLDPTPQGAEQWVKLFELEHACRRVEHLSIDIETEDKGAAEDELDGGVAAAARMHGILFEAPEDEEAFEASELDDRSYVILRCGYSYHVNGVPRVLSMPWGGPYHQFHKRLCASTVDKVFWNKGFDVPRILAQPEDGVPFARQWQEHIVEGRPAPDDEDSIPF
jgi:uracil-DNA glycosylase